MDITTRHIADLVELEVRGTLDSSWAAHLAGAIDETIRGGSHRLLVNLRDVTYLSSAGIAVLVHAHKQLKQIHGFFGVCDLSPHCLNVLRLTGLEKLLVCDGDAVRNAGGSAATTAPRFRLTTGEGYAFETYDLAASGPMLCRVFGRPAALAARGFDAADSRRIPFPADTCGFGLGAFGGDFEHCRSRFGEFLAVTGNAAQLPGEEGAAPDYQIAREAFVPEVHLLYGLQFTTGFSRLVRFQPGTEVRRIALSTLASQCLALAEADVAGLVIAAESSGLVGAALKRSPALAMAAEEGPWLAHPEVRRWLSFTPERSYHRTLALVVGVVARAPLSGESSALDPFLRPLGESPDLVGHFHAAVFPYRAVKKGRLDLAATAATLFETETIQAVLHLLHDGRPINGAGESEFVSGACWIGPVAETSAEGSSR